jgi:pimeloyl-ACP methyl ester carboxylesterase
VLDSIRAAQALVEPGPAAPSAIFGHSQGGHATLFAAQLAPSYAPELRIVGVASMAPPTDLGGLFQDDIHETAGVALTALAVRSWSSYYPDASEDAVVHAGVRGIVQKVGERCIITTEQGIADVPDIAILRTRFLSTDPVTQPGWAPHFTTNSLGATTLTVPALVAQGLKDTIVRPDTTTAYVGRQCQAGASITYDTYVDDDHFSVRTTSAPTVVEWLEARLAGTPATKGCTTTAIPKSAG